LIVRFRKQLFVALLLSGLLCVIAPAVFSQSSDQSLPTAVSTNEINGRIAALDLGDARLTRHFYAFEGTPGDLLITIDSKNLNGDMDVFTAITFRPLIKTTLYASSQPGEVTKGIYLRAHQILILRVEARTPNDEEGSYHVRFGGTFQPFSGGIPVADNTEATNETAPGRGNKRLSSVGATIAEPVVEAPPANAEPKTVASTEKPSEDTDAAKKTAKKRPAKRTSTARNTRGRVRPARPKPATSDTETPKTSEAKTEETKSTEDKSAGTKPESAKTDTGAPAEGRTAKSKAQEIPAPSAHLIIESKDGTRIDRPMSTVRRVVVEGGVIVIVLKTGRTERVPMCTVNRMAIEP